MLKGGKIHLVNLSYRYCAHLKTILTNIKKNKNKNKMHVEGNYTKLQSERHVLN